MHLHATLIVRGQGFLRDDTPLLGLGSSPDLHLCLFELISHSSVDTAHDSAETRANSGSGASSGRKLRSSDRASSRSLKRSDAGAREHLIGSLNRLSVTPACSKAKSHCGSDSKDLKRLSRRTSRSRKVFNLYFHP
jgi:hypothetical protein